MEPAWSASWAWGLSLISVTTAVHAFGIVMIFRGLQWVGQITRSQEQDIRHPTTLAVLLIAIVGLLLSILHGFEAALWAAAYLLVGAIGSQRDAVLYSLDSFTTRGASGLELGPEWRLMGALEAADGMLLFGISTAFVFTVMYRIVGTTDDIERPHL
ncbi:MAG: hypothetical protein P4L90_00760 [Rhodopila sp.]|nr:hypothetical protein [Rhodopila sp.]